MGERTWGTTQVEKETSIGPPNPHLEHRTTAAAPARVLLKCYVVAGGMMPLGSAPVVFTVIGSPEAAPHKAGGRQSLTTKP